MAIDAKSSMKSNDSVRRIFFYPFLLIAIPLASVILSQDLQIFPGAVWALRATPDTFSVPASIEASRILVEDGVALDVWKEPATLPERSNLRGIIFHGNGGWVGSTYAIQKWLARAGIDSYAFDYRGYGRSSGWPSEKNIYSDSDLLWESIRARATTPIRSVVIGSSLGGAPAARFALRHHAHTLILISAFTSLPDLVSLNPLYRSLTPFLWYHFPTKEYVSKLQGTCTIIAHGTNDTVIPVSHGRELFSAAANPKRLLLSNSDHNALFHEENSLLTEELNRCLDDPLPLEGPLKNNPKNS